MSLDIYRNLSAGVYSLYAEYGINDGRLPVTTTHDGVLGEVVEVLLYLRNDDPSEYYDYITITPVSLVAPSLVDNVSTGFGIKLSPGETQPTEADWTAVDYAASIDMTDIGSAGSGDTSSYLPFWARFEVPAGANADNKDTVVLEISFTSHPV